MVGLDSSPGMREDSLPPSASVRWRLFVNSLRTVRGRLELVARIFMFLGYAACWRFGGSVGLGLAPGISLSHGEPECLAVLFWPVFLFWQFFPVLASAFSENIDSSNLLRFPVDFPLLLFGPHRVWFAGAGHRDRHFVVAGIVAGDHRRCSRRCFSWRRSLMLAIRNSEYSSRPDGLCLDRKVAGPAPHARTFRSHFFSFHH